MVWYFLTPSTGKYGPFVGKREAEFEAQQWAESVLSKIKVVEE